MEGLQGFGVLTHARCCSQLPTGSSPGEPGDFVPGQPVPVRASVVSADRLPGTAGEEDETRARFALPVVMEPVELAVLFGGECFGFKNDRPAVAVHHQVCPCLAVQPAALVITTRFFADERTSSAVPMIPSRASRRLGEALPPGFKFVHAATSGAKPAMSLSSQNAGSVQPAPGGGPGPVDQPAPPPEIRMLSGIQSVWVSARPAKARASEGVST